MNIADEYTNSITSAALPNPKVISLKEIQEAREKDRTLRAVRAALKTGYWYIDLVKDFRKVKDELSVDHTNKVILRGTRIVIPEELQSKIVKLSHEGHPGIARFKALLREHVWFPNMDKQVKDEISHCIPCQATTQGNPPEPLQSREMPKGPWQTLHLDFYGPLPTNEYLFVTIDSYSRYPEVEVVKSTSSNTVIPKLDSTFARHGLLYKVVTDNGPPFQSNEFSRYMQMLDIKHEPSTPLWPQGNSDVESFMKPLGKAITIAKIENRPIRQELSRFLFSYRTTPHSTTGVPSSQLLFNRKIRGKLPMLNKDSKTTNRHREAGVQNERRKEQSREYGNRRRDRQIDRREYGMECKEQ